MGICPLRACYKKCLQNAAQYFALIAFSLARVRLCTLPSGNLRASRLACITALFLTVILSVAKNLAILLTSYEKP